MAIAIREGGAPAPPDPDELDDMIARLIELRDIAFPRREPEELWKRSRLCVCERPLPLADEWFPSLVRCLHCGRDVDDNAGAPNQDPAVAAEIIELAGIVREHNPTALERIGNELYPCILDDPNRCSFPNDGRLEVEPVSDRVNVVRLRDAFLHSGLTASEVCHRLGWLCKGDTAADTSRLTRALGLAEHQGRGRSYRAQRISVERAALICRALNVDPWEVGL